MTKRLLPYINRHTGDVRVMNKKDGSQLNEDWARAKMATNDQGERVFRFHLDAEVQGKDGNTHMGTATVDLTEAEMPADGLEGLDG